MITITMDDSRLINITQLRAFLKGLRQTGFRLDGSPEEKYAFIDRVGTVKYLV